MGIEVFMDIAGRFMFYYYTIRASCAWRSTGSAPGREAEKDAALDARFYAGLALQNVSGVNQRSVGKAMALRDKAKDLCKYFGI